MIQKEYAFDKNEFNEEAPIHQFLAIDLGFLKDNSHFNIKKNKEVIDRLFGHGREWHDYGNTLYKTINLFLKDLHELSEQPFNHYKLYQLLIQTIESYLDYLLANNPDRLQSFLDPKAADFLSYLELRHYFFAKKGIEKGFSEKYPDLIKLAKESYLKAEDLIEGNASIIFETKLISLLEDNLSQVEKDIIHEDLIQLANNNNIINRQIIIDNKYFTKDIDKKINLEHYLSYISFNDSHTNFLKYLANEFHNSKEEHSKLLNERIVNFLNYYFTSKDIFLTINQLDLSNLDLTNLKHFNKFCFEVPIMNKNTILDPLNPDIILKYPKFQVDKDTLKLIENESKKYNTISSFNKYLAKNNNNFYILDRDLSFPLTEVTYEISGKNIKGFPYIPETFFSNAVPELQEFYHNILSKSTGGMIFLKLLCLEALRKAPNVHDILDEAGMLDGDNEFLDIVLHSYFLKHIYAKETLDQIINDSLKDRKNLQIENEQLKQQIEELKIQNQQESLQALEPKGTKRKAMEGKEEINPNENHPEPLGVHTKRLKSLKDSSDISKGSLRWL